MAESAAVYLRLVAARVRAQWQYRTSFALQMLGVFLISFVDFAAILVIFENVPQLAGWTVEEVALLYGMGGLAFALTELVAGHLDLLPRLIRDGNFDLVLIRPRGSLFQVLAGDVRLRQLGKVAQSSAVLAFALASVDVEWSTARAALLPLAILSGAAIFAAIWVAAICLVFWAVEGREAVSAFTDAGNFATQYPIDVYERWLQRLVTVVVPVAFVAYFPATYILDKPNALGAPDWLSFVSPVVAVVAAVVAGYLWRFAVRHYRSAGG
ncbi:MAG TPA: ABC-2 family transporter protein [Gaiellaceae bacterium]|nr:ABC-2 family transporter protein [Gaiellaceae bacterium]